MDFESGIKVPVPRGTRFHMAIIGTVEGPIIVASTNGTSTESVKGTDFLSVLNYIALRLGAFEGVNLGSDEGIRGDVDAGGDSAAGGADLGTPPPGGPDELATLLGPGNIVGGL